MTLRRFESWGFILINQEIHNQVEIWQAHLSDANHNQRVINVSTNCNQCEHVAQIYASKSTKKT
jgi:hypothetical protein